MISEKTSWKYDAAACTVTDTDGQTVICHVPPSQEPALGHIIASLPAMSNAMETMLGTLDKWSFDIQGLDATMKAAPVMTAISHDLRAQLSASLVAWKGEEESVREEHAELIATLQAADKRADEVLGALGAKLSADTLRALATVLLESAHQIDGLQPYVVNHSHRHGDTIYTMWSATPPTDKEMARFVGEEFEEDRGETLEHHAMQVREMTGARGIHQATNPEEEEEESEDLGYGPASM